MNRVLTALVSAAALWLAACGGSGNTIQPPPPNGKFTPASLNGTYSFTTSGEVLTNGALTPISMTRVGSFTADGKGGISGGVEDVNASGTFNPAIAVIGGSYTVSAEGRGTLTLNLAGGTSVSFGIVLTSGSSGLTPAADGLMIDETTFSNLSNQASTGSGNFILQTGAPFSIGIASGTYVFDFFGLDGTQNPDSIVGEINVNAGVVTGVQDENNSFVVNLPPTPTPVSFVGGTLAQDPTDVADFGPFGRGIASMNGINYVFYLVSADRIRFLSTSGSTMLSGDAVLQTNPPANLTTSFAFVVAGAGVGGGVTRVGRLTFNGSTVSKVLMDTNDGANRFLPTNSVTSSSVTMDPANPGRGVLNFTDPNVAVPFTFVFYLSSPTSGVIQEESQSASNGAVDVADGSILAQTGNPFTGSNITGAYGMNWSGVVTAGGVGTDEEDLVSQTTVTSLSLTGTSDFFQFNSATLTPMPNIGTTGQINFNGGDGAGDDGNRVDLDVTLSNTSPIHMVVYIVNPQLAFFANRDNNGAPRIVAGILSAQQ